MADIDEFVGRFGREQPAELQSLEVIGNAGDQDVIPAGGALHREADRRWPALDDCARQPRSVA